MAAPGDGHQVRRRLRGKQAPLAPLSVAPASELATCLEAEAADGLVPIAQGGRRYHFHYTHVRAERAADLQPSQMTREKLWHHMVRCYREAYPAPASLTACILQFGVVCKELHKDVER